MNVRVKKLLSMLVVLAMVISMIVPMNFSTVKAEETTEEESGYVNPGQDKIDMGKRVQRRSAEVKDTFLNATGEVTAVCPVCAEEKTWTAIDSTWVAGTSISAAGHYYLAEDIDYDFGEEGNKSYIKAGHTVCLNLNGKTVNINAGRFLDVSTSRTVSVVDTAGNAEVTGTLNNEADKGSTIRTYSDAASDLHLYGGTFKKADDVLAEGVTDNDLANPAIYVRGGSLNIYADAKLSGAVNSGKGGNVFLPAGATLNMYGGVLENGSATHGGNVSLAEESTLNMYDGAILNGTASTSGGNLYVYRKCALNIYGGFIASTSANNIYIDTNTSKYPDNIPTITISGGTVVGGITAKEQLSATISDIAKVVPSAEYEGVTYTGTRGVAKLSFDATALTEGADVWMGGSMTSSYTWCEACQAVKEWTTIAPTEAVVMEGGHYRLNGDVTYQYEADAAANNFFTGVGCLDLNGCDVTIDGGRFLYAVAGTVNVFDTQGGAVVAGSMDRSGNAGATLVVESDDAAVTLYGGTYKATVDSLDEKENETSIIRHRRGTLTIKDGVTVDASDYAQIGKYDAVYIGASATAAYGQSFLMEGGEIVGGLYLECTSTTTISGGTVNDGVTVKTGASLALSGAPVIAETGLSLGEGVLVDVNGLTADASVFVDAQLDVPFTAAYEGEADLTGVFCAALADSQVTQNAEKQFVFAEKKVPVPNLFDPWNFDGLAYCPICGGEEPVLWTVISEPTVIEAGNHYYFAENIEYDYADNAKHHFLDGAGCVNLNGKTITINAGRFLRATGTTNVMDTAGGAVVTGSSNLTSDEGATIYINSNAKLSLYGGTYKAMDDTLPEGVDDTDVDICAVRVRYGTLNMYEGATIDGEDYNSGAEALVYVGYQGDNEYAAKVNMYGGTIQNGSSTGNGGNVKIYPTGGGTAVVTIDGGVIQDGTANNGGNIYVRGGTLNISGGVIQNGEASGNGGNIYTRAATVNVDDGAILNGTASTGGGNMYVYRDVTLNISDGFIGGGTGNGSNIYMDVKNDGTAAPTVALSGGTVVGGIAAGGDMTATLSGAVKVLPAAEYEGKTYTAADGGIRACKVDTTGLTKGADVWMYRELNLSYTWCEACQAVEAWTTLTEPTEMAGGHYRLKDDITYSYTDDSDHSFLTGYACVDLNGCDVTVNAGRFLDATSAGATNIVDTKGGAVVTGSCNRAGNAAATIRVMNAEADVTLWGGTYKAMDDTFEGEAKDNNTSIIRHRIGKLTMKEGATVDATGYEWLGTYAAVYIGAAADATDVQTFLMEGGEIVGGLYLEGTSATTISGGTVNDGVTAKTGATLALSGAPVITGTGLALGAEVLADISGLTTDAKINVTGSGEGGVFTEAFDGAAALQSVFTVTNGYALYLNENQFALVVAVAFIDGVPYSTIEEAMEAYDIAEGKMIALNGEVAISEDIILDAANSNKLVLSGSGTVYGVDTSNDTFGAYNKVEITGDIVVADEYTSNDNRYMALKEGETTYGFHRFAVKLTHVTLRATAAGLYYKAEIQCDETLRDRVDAYGVVLSTVDMPGADFVTSTHDLYTVIEGQFANLYGAEVANTVKTTSGSVFGILKDTSTGRTAEANTAALATDIYANGYILVDKDGNGDTQLFMADAGVKKNLIQVVTAVNELWIQENNGISESAKKGMVEFVAKWADQFDADGAAQWAAATSNIVA